MDFAKNSTLFHKICSCYIRGIDGLVDIKEITYLYNTPSSIRATDNSRYTKSGRQHNRSVSLRFPGISDSDFSKFDQMLSDRYQLIVRLDNGQLYELFSAQFPATLTTSYSMSSGHQLTFAGVSPFPIAYSTTDAIPDTTTGVPDDDTGFDYFFDFNVT